MPGGELIVALRGRQAGGRPVLAPIAFRAAAGERLALLGPSGTGKTTLLHAVLGLGGTAAGEVTRPERVAAVFQEPRLLPWLSVAQNLRLVRPDLEEADIASLLEAMGLAPGVAALRPGQLSLGMARRVAIARALAVAPALLVLDEPFASLDPAMAGRVARHVAEVARERGTTVLLATHDLAQARIMADRVLVLEGRPARLVRDVGVEAVGGGELGFLG
jgi:ABC-type nitrate/sulfonate/bicarbonate transport system ATPase subunit